MAINKIINKGDGVQFEIEAAAEVTPGMALERQANGDVAPHSGGVKPALFAIEFPEMGKGVNHNYPVGDPVKMLSPYRGSELELLIAPNQTADPSDTIVSNGDGSLAVGDGTETYDDIVGFPAYDFATGADAERHTVRVI